MDRDKEIKVQGSDSLSDAVGCIEENLDEIFAQVSSDSKGGEVDEGWEELQAMLMEESEHTKKNSKLDSELELIETLVLGPEAEQESAEVSDEYEGYEIPEGDSRFASSEELLMLGMLEEEAGRPIIREDRFLKGGEGEPQLTERARLGRFEPEEEVKYVEVGISKDYRYAAKDCKAEESPEDRRLRRMVRIQVAALFLLLILIGVGLWFGLQYSGFLHGKKELVFGQHVCFHVDGVSWKRMAVSSNGRWMAVCNDKLGALYSVEDMRMVAQFYPPAEGCYGLQIWSGDANVLVLGNMGRLYRFEPGYGGYELQYYHKLPAESVDRFYQGDDGIYYVDRDLGDYRWSKLNFEGEVVLEKSIPSGAKLCKGEGLKVLGYYSSNRLHLWDGESDQEVSGLDDVKFVDCWVLGHGGKQWFLLGDDGYLRRGEGNMDGGGMNLGHHFGQEDEVVLGALDYSTVYLASGDKLYEINERSKGVQSVLLDARYSGDDFIFASSLVRDKLLSLRGGQLGVMTLDGKFVGVEGGGSSVRGIYFVGHGDEVLAVEGFGQEQVDGEASRLLWWSLRSGHVSEGKVYASRIENVSFSHTGRYMLLSYRMGGEIRVDFFDLENDRDEAFGTMVVTSPVVDVRWGLSGEYFVLYFGDNRKSLMQYDGKSLKARVEISKESEVDIFRDKDLVVWDGKVLRSYGLSDDRVSVPALNFDSLKKSHGGDFKGFSGIKTHPYSMHVVLWGSGGLYTYDVSNGRGRWLSRQAVSWVGFERSGFKIASEIGTWHLMDEGSQSSQYESREKLSWSGDGRYLLDKSGRFAIFESTGEQVALIGNDTMYSIACLGDNCGMHPGADFILSKRGNAVGIERLSDGEILGLFGGESQQRWCWMSISGEAQGEGEYCHVINEAVGGNDQEQQGLKTGIFARNQLLEEKLGQFDWEGHQYRDYFADNQSRMQNWVDLRITTDPEDVSFYFAVDEGSDLPEELVKVNEQGGGSPLNVRLKRSEVWVGAVIMKEGYKTEVLSFQLDSKLLEYHVNLVDNLTWESHFESDCRVRDEIEESEGLTTGFSEAESVSMRRILSLAKGSVEECLGKDLVKGQKMHLSLDSNGTGKIVSVSNFDDVQKCLGGLLIDGLPRVKSSCSLSVKY